MQGPSIIMGNHRAKRIYLYKWAIKRLLNKKIIIIYVSNHKKKKKQEAFHNPRRNGWPTTQKTFVYPARVFVAWFACPTSVDDSSVSYCITLFFYEWSKERNFEGSFLLLDAYWKHCMSFGVAYGDLLRHRHWIKRSCVRWTLVAQDRWCGLWRHMTRLAAQYSKRNTI